jgi:hypothetical protein
MLAQRALKPVTKAAGKVFYSTQICRCLVIKKGDFLIPQKQKSTAL